MKTVIFAECRRSTRAKAHPLELGYFTVTDLTELEKLDLSVD